MPKASYWPIFVALGLAFAAAGVIYSYPMSAVGVVMIFYGTFAWTQESTVGPPARPSGSGAGH
jgi:hypothetical protein